MSKMALADFLKAFQELIFNSEKISSDLTQRQKDYKKRFPKLSENEIADLAKIEPSKIKIYTGTIFKGEAIILEKRLPQTIFYLKEHWNKISGTHWDLAKTLNQLNNQTPWKGYKTKSLVDIFLNFLEQKIPQEQSWINELAKVEAIIAEIRRSASLHPCEQKWIKDLYHQSVEKMLAQRFSCGTCLKTDCFEFDLKSFYLNNKKASSYFKNSTPIKKKTFLAISRDLKYMCRLTELSAEEFSLLTLAKKSSRKIEELASAFVLADPDKDRTDEAVFSSFLERLLLLEKNGVIYLHD